MALEANGGGPPRELRLGRARIFPVNRTIRRPDGGEERIDYKALQVLLCLAASAGKTVEKSALFGRVWPGQAVSEEVLPNAIRVLRRALEDDARRPTYIETIPRVGYRLLVPAVVPTRSRRLRRIAVPAAVASLTIVVGLATVVTTGNDGSAADEAAERAYLRALYLSRAVPGPRRSDLEAAVAELEKAIEADPHFARAWARLAMLHVWLWQRTPLGPAEARQRIVPALQRALALDPKLAEGRRVAGIVAMTLDWDFARAERELTRAAELQPADWETRYWFVQLLTLSGRFDEALAELHHLCELAPQLLAMDYEAYVLNLAGRHRQAVERIDEQLELAPRAPDLWLQKAASHFYLGDTSGAARALGIWHRLREVGPEAEVALEAAPPAAGPEVLLRKALAEHYRRGAGGVDEAAILAQLGDRDGALEILERGAHERRPWILFIAWEPGLAPLRQEPRFQALLARIGLPEPPGDSV